MAKTHVVRDPVHEDSFFILEESGVMTQIRNSLSGVAIYQRRPGREKGSFHMYEDYGLSVYPHLFRLLGSTGSHFPTIPKPTRKGNDDYAERINVIADYIAKQPYPFSQHQAGDGNTHTIVRFFIQP